MTWNPHRREGRRRALLTAGAIGCTIGALVLVRGLTMWLWSGDDSGVAVALAGAGILAVCVLGSWWAARTFRRAVEEDALDASLSGVSWVPFGARPHGDGVLLRPRAALRFLPPLLVPLLLLTMLGMVADGLAPQGLAVGCLAVVVAVVSLLLHRYQICLGPTGVWKRRRPRWKLAWTDLASITPREHNRRFAAGVQDDLELHGRVAMAWGRQRERVRVRCCILAISTTDFRRLADDYVRLARAKGDRGLGTRG